MPSTRGFFLTNENKEPKKKEPNLPFCFFFFCFVFVVPFLMIAEWNKHALPLEIK